VAESEFFQTPWEARRRAETLADRFSALAAVVQRDREAFPAMDPVALTVIRSRDQYRAWLGGLSFLDSTFGSYGPELRAWIDVYNKAHAAVSARAPKQIQPPRPMVAVEPIAPASLARPMMWVAALGLGAYVLSKLGAKS